MQLQTGKTVPEALLGGESSDAAFADAIVAFINVCFVEIIGLFFNVCLSLALSYLHSVPIHNASFLMLILLTHTFLSCAGN